MDINYQDPDSVMALMREYMAKSIPDPAQDDRRAFGRALVDAGSAMSSTPGNALQGIGAGINKGARGYLDSHDDTTEKRGKGAAAMIHELLAESKATKAAELSDARITNMQDKLDFLKTNSDLNRESKLDLLLKSLTSREGIAARGQEGSTARNDADNAAAQELARLKGEIKAKEIQTLEGGRKDRGMAGIASREKIAAGSQAGQDRRIGLKGDEAVQLEDVKDQNRRGGETQKQSGRMELEDFRQKGKSELEDKRIIGRHSVAELRSKAASNAKGIYSGSSNPQQRYTASKNHLLAARKAMLGSLHQRYDKAEYDGQLKAFDKYEKNYWEEYKALEGESTPNAAGKGNSAMEGGGPAMVPPSGKPAGKPVTAAGGKVDIRAQIEKARKRGIKDDAMKAQLKAAGIPWPEGM